MVKITYIAADGVAQTIDGTPGHTLMETAVKNGVEAIVGECGGSCACGTCRIYVPSEWQAKAGHASDMERDMLSFVGEADSSARLSCQIVVQEALDGLTVRMPDSQH